MGLFKKLSDLFSAPEGRPEKRDEASYWVAVRCSRCGETLRTRVNLHNDLSIEYGEGGGETTYFCRKTLIGDKLCFQRFPFGAADGLGVAFLVAFKHG